MTQAGRTCLIQSCIRLLLLLSGLLSAPIIHASNPDPIFDRWRWVNFTTANGLPSNIVRNVVETKNRIWALTRGGIAWFDDYQWHPMGPNLGLPDGQTRNLVAMGDGSVLVIVDAQLYRGTERGFIHLPTVNNGTTIRVRQAQPLSSHRFILESDGKLYDYENGIIQDFRSATIGEIENDIKLIRTRAGLWLSTTTQLYRWEDDDWQPENLAFDKWGQIDWLVETPQGERLGLQITHTEAALYTWNKTEPHQPVNVVAQLCIAADLGPNGEAIAVDSYYSTWLRQDKGWFKFPQAPEQFSQAKFLKFRTNGDLWLGTDKGLFLCRRSSDRWTRIPASPNQSPIGINEFLSDHNGSLWIATERGLSVHTHDGTANRVPHIEGHEQSPITALIGDIHGHIWVGSGIGAFKGAYRYDGNVWQHIECKPGEITPAIHKIRRDNKGQLWFLALSQGIDDISTRTSQPGVYHLKNNTLVPWAPSLDLSSGRVYEFVEGPDGAFWFGTWESLSRWQNKEWTHWNPLPITAIRALTVDSQNRVWFSDFSHGLGYLEDDQLHLLSIVDGLPSDRIMDLAIDQYDTLWMTTWGDGLLSYRNGAWSNHSEGMSSLYAWPVRPQGDHLLIGTIVGADRMKIERRTHPGNRVIILPPSIVNRGANSHWAGIPALGRSLPRKCGNTLPT